MAGLTSKAYSGRAAVPALDRPGRFVLIDAVIVIQIAWSKPVRIMTA
jgi:hypothetical protein